MSELFEDRGAVFSPCRTWRYRLWRTWDDSRFKLPVIGLNPSTADEALDDPTIRRCRGFAKDWGFGGLVMLNIFGYRSTDPKALRDLDDPVGPENDAHILRATTLTPMTALCAWGNGGDLMSRGAIVRDMLTAKGVQLVHLGLTKMNQPRHPLYVRASQPAIHWSQP